MRAVTIKEAKAHLNELVDAAVTGEQVVLMRGAKHVAAIIPVSAEEIELPPRLTDSQAERLWQEIRREREAGGVREFASPKAAVAHLQRQPRGVRSARGRK